MEKSILLPKTEWRLIVQLFADDISAAVAHKDRRVVVTLSEEPARILIKVLKELGLEIAPNKRNNFLVGGGAEARKELARGTGATYKQRKREQTLQRMQRDVERLESEQLAARQVQLFFRWVFSFKLLGFIIDCGWTFRQHFVELRGRLVRRLQALGKVSGAVW